MIKAEFISILNEWYSENGIDNSKCHVSHGGSMLMLGLREETEDVDLAVPKDVWDKFKGVLEERFYPACNSHPVVTVLIATDKIDLHLMQEGEDCGLEEESGVYYRNALVTLEDKLRLNRPKDQKDIEKLRKLIGEI